MRTTKGHIALDLFFDKILAPNDAQSIVYDEARGNDLTYYFI